MYQNLHVKYFATFQIYKLGVKFYLPPYNTNTEVMQ